MSPSVALPPASNASQPASLRERHADLRTWFFEQALPFWWAHGTDHRQGGYFEKVTQAGGIIDEPRRTRVTARQIYVFSVAHTMGWSGPSLQAMRHGLDFLLERQRKPDGTYASAVTVQGVIVDDRFDLYEQAFALFAMAHAYKADPGRTELPQLARQLFSRLREGWSHPVLGFEESRPSSLPLRSNPHMHLLEALIAWDRLGPLEQRPEWRQAGSELVELCLHHLMTQHPEGGSSPQQKRAINGPFSWFQTALDYARASLFRSFGNPSAPRESSPSVAGSGIGFTDRRTSIIWSL